MFKNILIAGSGVLGSEIGFQCPVGGLTVEMLDGSEDMGAAARRRHADFAAEFVSAGRMTEADTRVALSRISYGTDAAAAGADADIVSESVSERIEVKEAIWRAMSAACPARTIFTTNTSTLLPSVLASFTDRPERFVACHVGRPVWTSRLLEIMPHAGTDPTIIGPLRDFANRIGLVPIVLKREQPGYVSNSLIAPFVITALDLIRRDVASPQDIDRLWMGGLRGSMGPAALIDLMGIPTVHTVLDQMAHDSGREDLRGIADYLRSQMLDRGLLGAQNGKGFYTYPDPAFERADFLNGEPAPAPSFAKEL